jgi:glycosyltransferase involved in cell wall biosynthesis
MVNTYPKPLSVLLVVEPGLDGVFRHVEGLVEYLLTQNQRIHLAYSSRRSGQAMTLLVERVRRTGGETIDLRVANTPQIRDFSALSRLIGLIRRTRPDVIHAHSSKAGVLARAAAIITGHRQCLYTPHAYYGMAKPPSLRVGFFNWVERVAARYATTIAISKEESDFAVNRLHIDRAHIHIIHNPVDTARFQPATPEQRRSARLKLGIPEDITVLATIGRMCWQKDPETAYRAVAPVCQRNPALLFLHLGWGKWNEYLRGFSQELGFKSQLRILEYTDDPRAFYHAVDGVLITSRYEAGWPLVLLESLSCNLPVMTATCLGMSDVDQAGLSEVWTFSPEDVAGCTAAVEAWLASHTRNNHERNHREFAAERLSPERCYGAVLQLYYRMPVPSVSPVQPISQQAREISRRAASP